MAEGLSQDFFACNHWKSSLQYMHRALRTLSSEDEGDADEEQNRKYMEKEQIIVFLHSDYVYCL